MYSRCRLTSCAFARKANVRPIACGLFDILARPRDESSVLRMICVSMAFRSSPRSEVTQIFFEVHDRTGRSQRLQKTKKKKHRSKILLERKI
jgi:hypothetical protein